MYEAIHENGWFPTERWGRIGVYSSISLGSCMRKCVHIGFIFLFLQGLCYAQFEWSNPILIADGNNPDFDIDKVRRQLHIVSVGSAGKGVTYIKTDSLGNILFVEPKVPETDYEYGEWQFGPAVAVDKDGYPHICYRLKWGLQEYRKWSVYYIRRSASGWSPSLTIAEAAWRAYMVRLVVDANNVVHIARGSSAPDQIKNGPVFYYRIVNGKLQTIRSDLVPYRADDRLEMALSPNGDVHLVLGNPDPSQAPTPYYRATDAGTKISLVADIHSTQCWSRNGCPDVFVDAAGNVHFSYGALADNDVAGLPSVRYTCYSGDTKVQDAVVTQPGDLQAWKNGEGYGISSVATNDDGQYVVVAYLTNGGDPNKPPGDLYVRHSTDGGSTWSASVLLATQVGGSEGKNFHLIRAYGNHFYVVYPKDNKIWLRHARNFGDSPPTAVAGGPYTGFEGDSLLLDMSGSTDVGTNAGIVEYAWDWDQNGVYDFFTQSPLAKTLFKDDFQGTAVLRVTDRAGKRGFDTASITIANVAPTVKTRRDTTCNEGDGIVFTCEVTDPGADTHTFSWNFKDGTSSTEKTVTHVFREDGQYVVVVTVGDDDGGTGSDSSRVLVKNVNPTPDAGGPYRGSIHVPVSFHGTAYDPGLDDQLTHTWDLDDNGIFETPGKDVSRAFSSPGTYVIWLKVEDDDGGSGLDSTRVLISNEAPGIGSIPNQTINEGQVFNPVRLDDYVDDPDQDDDALIWSYRGNRDLIVTLADRILTVAIPDSEWWGKEILTLTVRDPGDQADSTSVSFTVLPVNDPPVWQNVPDYTFNEDDTLRILLSSLRALVIDVDDHPSSLRFWTAGGTFIRSFVDATRQTLNLTALPDWYGKENIFFVVSDTSGATDRDTSLVTVKSVPDPPRPFSLINPINNFFPDWPDTILFQWHRSIDPDPGDLIVYEWTLRPEGANGSQTLTHVVQDTTVSFLPDGSLDAGTFLWWIVAKDQTGLMMDSDIGILVVGNQTSVDPPVTNVPSNFELLQNYPNPFNPETRITYHLPTECDVRLAVYNTLGREVRLLDEGRKSAGVHTIAWDGFDRLGQKVPTGLYIYRLQAGSRIFYRKMMLIQ